MKQTIINFSAGDSRENIKNILAKMPVALQTESYEAFCKEQEEDYDGAVRICSSLFDKGLAEDQPELRMLLGRCYFALEEDQAAAKVFGDLTEDYPDEIMPHLQLGMTCHAMGNFRVAAEQFRKIYPLPWFDESYLKAYGDAMQRGGFLKEARELFFEVVAHFEETGITEDELMLEGAFHNLLYLDAALANGRFEEDRERYLNFLDQADRNEKMQGQVCDTIAYVSTMMENRWFRPVFRRFIDAVESREWFKEWNSQDVVTAARAAAETYDLHEEHHVSALTEEYVGASYGRKYHLQDATDQEVKDAIEAKALTYEWNVTRYYPDHADEFDTIRDSYPLLWDIIKDFIARVKTDAEGTGRELLEAMKPYVVSGTSEEALLDSLQKAYDNIAANMTRENERVRTGEGAVKRTGIKIGRNDPCPCGSGKKYKHCCGR